MSAPSDRQTRPRFHLAFPVDDLEAARAFYGGQLGCGEGRSSDRWVDFDLFGHQVVAQLVDEREAAGPTNPVDGHDVPVRHFGLILDFEQWDELAARLDGSADFIMDPTVRFAGEAGEQRTMFVRDPAGNALEFKAFADESQIFATDSGPSATVDG